jgi:hypothetical protein
VHTEYALPQSEERKIKTIRLLRKEALQRAIEALSTPLAVRRSAIYNAFAVAKSGESAHL